MTKMKEAMADIVLQTEMCPGCKAGVWRVEKDGDKIGLWCLTTNPEAEGFPPIGERWRYRLQRV